MNSFKVSVIIGALLAILLVYCKTTSRNIPEKVLVKGSETELFLIKRFAEAYQNVEHNVNVSVTGGGSQFGIQSLINNETDIANASRLISEEEKSALTSKGIKWTQAIIAVDAIAIITHPSLRLNYISLYQLSAIFSGKITNWKQIGGPDKPIHLYGRKLGSGTHDFVQHRLQIDAYGRGIHEFEKYEDILSGVKNDSNAIAYISSSYIKQNVPSHVKSVLVLNVFTDSNPEYSPFDETAINNGDYALIRPLFQYYNTSDVNPAIKRFIQFELSPKGQSLLRLSGYYPINVFHRQINSHNGIREFSSLNTKTENLF